MKIPASPPDYKPFVAPAIAKAVESRLELRPADPERGYLHWNKLRYLPPPEPLSHEEWWAMVKLARASRSKLVPLQQINGQPFWFCDVDPLPASLHWFDMHCAGTLTLSQPVINEDSRNTYLIRSLVEEAISSSQLEGAATTRVSAKEMIRQNRHPRDKSEQMILNNFHAMQFIQEIKKERLTPEIIFELHRLLTEDTLDNPAKAGCFREDEDDINVVDNTDGKILHQPPPAKTLPERLMRLCEFANEPDKEQFVHPIVRAIILHFMLAYDHPFVDGNGRTARALFYWCMAREGYWMMEYISISKIIKISPTAYGKAYLETETDGGDLTYFVLYQLEVIKRAIDELQRYLHDKQQGISEAEALLRHNSKLRGKLNFRQLALLRHALRHPRFAYRVQEHQNSHGVVYETARRDLIQMSDTFKLLTKVKDGKSFLFLVPDDLEARLGR